MFYPGETDLHVFTLPFSSDDVGSVLVSYKQKGRVVLEKTAGNKETLTTASCRVSVELTQSETMRFVDNEAIYIQLNVSGSDGGRITSNPLEVRCGEQYHRSVI